MSENIYNLNLFNLDAPASRLGIKLDGSVAHLASRFLHKKFLVERTCGEQQAIRDAEIYVIAVIREIDYRYGLYKDYSKDFYSNFADYDFNDNAICLAAICKTYLSEINGPTDKSPNERLCGQCRDDGFDEMTVYYASAFEEEALELVDSSLDKGCSYCLESIFLAHIKALESLSDMEVEITLESEDTLRHNLEKTLPNFKNIADKVPSLISKRLEMEIKEYEELALNRLKILVKPSIKSLPNFLRVIDGGKPA